MNNVWRFRFEDDGEIVGRDRGRTLGPWLTLDEAMRALNAEGPSHPSAVCYVLVCEPASAPRVPDNWSAHRKQYEVTV